MNPERLGTEALERLIACADSGMVDNYELIAIKVQARAELAALKGGAGQAKAMREALLLADVHVGWGDCTLENVHKIIRTALASPAI